MSRFFSTAGSGPPPAVSVNPYARLGPSKKRAGHFISEDGGDDDLGDIGMAILIGAMGPETYEEEQPQVKKGYH